MSAFKECARAYGWSLKDIEETNLESLLEFWNTKVAETEKVINGTTYKLAAKPPAFL